MSDMRGLVGIDARVLDQHFAGRDFLPWLLIRRQRGCDLGPIHADVDVSSPGHFEFFEAGYRADSGDDFLGNLAGRFAELAGKLKGNRQRVFAQLNFRRLLDDNIGQIEGIGAL